MILHLARHLREEPQSVVAKAFTTREIGLPGDVPAWLTLRQAATAELTPRPGPWSENDFRREFSAQDWFRNARMWVAEPVAMTESFQHGERVLAGSVTLAVRGSGDSAVGHIHWLLVHPDCRRMRLAATLMANLERACWEAGIRRVVAETHANWQAAVAFYRRLGYA